MVKKVILTIMAIVGRFCKQRIIAPYLFGTAINNPSFDNTSEDGGVERLRSVRPCVRMSNFGKNVQNLTATVQNLNTIVRIESNNVGSSNR
jgi:hypothetical protein